MPVRTCGACTELISTGPEVIHLLILIRQKRHLPLRNISWPIQKDVVEEHLARTARLWITPVAETNTNRIDISKVHTLVCKLLQVNIPFGPLSCQRRIGIIIIDHSAAIENYIHQLSSVK